MAQEVLEVREDPEDREVPEVLEDPVVLPQNDRDHQEVPVAQEALLQNQNPVNREAQGDPGDQGVRGGLEDPADQEGLEVQPQKHQNQEDPKPQPRQSQQESLGSQEVQGDLEAQGDPEVQEVQEAREGQVVQEDQAVLRQQNQFLQRQPNLPRLQDHREGQVVLEDPEDLVGREDPVGPADLADQRQSLPVLLQNRPSMHLEIPVGQEVRADREGQADQEGPADQEGHLRLLLKHQRHQNQVSKNNTAA